MKFRNFLSGLLAIFYAINCFTSCSSTIGTPPVDNRSAKNVAVAKVSDALLGNQEQEIIYKNNKLFQKNQDIERKIKSNSEDKIDRQELSALLKLNESQKVIFDKSFKEYDNGKNSIIESLSMDEYEKQGKITQLVKKRDESIVTVLDSFQVDIYKNYLLKNQ
jgi:hypothetical protein